MGLALQETRVTYSGGVWGPFGVAEVKIIRDRFLNQIVIEDEVERNILDKLEKWVKDIVDTETQIARF